MTPAELAEKLESFASEQDEKADVETNRAMRVGFGNEAKLLRQAAARLRVMEEALKDVCNPLAALRRDAEAKGAKLSGMAYEIANSLSYVQGIARAALERTSVTPVSIEQSK